MTHDRVLTAAGLAGFVFGLAVTAAGGVGGEFGQLMSGYGLLVTGSAAYLLVGLAVRRLLARRPRPTRGTVGLQVERRA